MVYLGVRKDLRMQEATRSRAQARIYKRSVPGAPLRSPTALGNCGRGVAKLVRIRCRRCRGCALFARQAPRPCRLPVLSWWGGWVTVIHPGLDHTSGVLAIFTVGPNRAAMNRALTTVGEIVMFS